LKKKKKGKEADHAWGTEGRGEKKGEKRGLIHMSVTEIKPAKKKKKRGEKRKDKGFGNGPEIGEGKKKKEGGEEPYILFFVAEAKKEKGGKKKAPAVRL